MRGFPACHFVLSPCLVAFRVFLVALILGGLASSAAHAQRKPSFAGDYGGMLGPLHVKLHVIAVSDGTLFCTVDSPDQDMSGVKCAGFHVNGQALSFTVATVNGTWTGLISNDGSSLTGVWSQGSPTPLNLASISATAAANSSAPAPPLPPMPKAKVTWDTYTYKFSLTGTMAQVFENGKVVGTILTMNGDQKILPLPGTDAEKMTKSFEDYKAFYTRRHSAETCCCARRATIGGRYHTDSDVTRPALGVIFSRPQSDACFGDSLRWRNPFHRFPQANGITVNFVGEDVKIAGFRKLNYIVRHQKAQQAGFSSAASHTPTLRAGACRAEAKSFCGKAAELFTIPAWAQTRTCR
jgi:hypothetical protein